ncbi:MAG: tyrosine-type recombinase/integrase [Chloroflexota bacterium]|nr:tyrosine-type recombinase/integrase [Chloroflexota bacterium]
MVDAASAVDAVNGAVFDALAVAPRLDGADWPQAADALIAVVTNRLHSDVSRRGYRTALRQFLTWQLSQSAGPFSRVLVQRYRVVLEGRGLAASTINQHLSAIRALADECAESDLLDQPTAAAIGRVKGVPVRGVRAGNWLTRDQAEKLLLAPPNTLMGLRDRAILGLLIGCGLRRDELATLTFEHVQQRDGRWVLVDLIGKGRRVRTVPVPGWAKGLVDHWATAAGLSSGVVFRRFRKGGFLVYETTGDGRVIAGGMSADAIADVVTTYARPFAWDLAPHDLRRTFAKLARNGQAPLEQIQLALGHQNIQTTQRYLGSELDLGDAACDRLGIRIQDGGS